MCITKLTRARHAQSVVQAALRSFRVVVVNGPRQAGKTTLARQLAPSAGTTLVSLDDNTQYEGCTADPQAFIDAYPRPLCIDEFQRAGEPLVRAIKMAVDADRSSGQFLLTGSSRFLTTAGLSESLAGRAAILELWPYTQGEADQLGPGADQLLAHLLDPNADLVSRVHRSYPSRTEYLDRLCRGGFPEVHDLAPSARPMWFDAYLTTIVQRDVPSIARGRQLGELPQLLRVIAARTSQEANVTAIAKDSRLDRSALSRNYLPLLENVYLTRNLPAWSRSPTARAVKYPKTYITDTGLAASLLGVEASALTLPNAPAIGPLVETFVVNELLRQRSFLPDVRAELYHFRSPDGPEIDVVIEATDGRVAAVEVKATSTVKSHDFRHLVLLRDRLDQVGQPFTRGAVIYLGDRALAFGDRLVALPLCHLWLPQ